MIIYILVAVLLLPLLNFRMPPKPKLNVQSFPRPPLLERTPRHIQIKWHGQTIADTKDAYWVLETYHPPSKDSCVILYVLCNSFMANPSFQALYFLGITLTLSSNFINHEKPWSQSPSYFFFCYLMIAGSPISWVTSFSISILLFTNHLTLISLLSPTHFPQPLLSP